MVVTGFTKTSSVMTVPRPAPPNRTAEDSVPFPCSPAIFYQGQTGRCLCTVSSTSSPHGMDDISTLGRITSGVKMINLDDNVKVARIAKVREKLSDGHHEIENLDDIVDEEEETEDK